MVFVSKNRKSFEHRRARYINGDAFVINVKTIARLKVVQEELHSGPAQVRHGLEDLKHGRVIRVL